MSGSSSVFVDVQIPQQRQSAAAISDLIKKKVTAEEIKVETVTITVTEKVTAEVTLHHAAAEGTPFPEAQPGAEPAQGAVSGTNGLFRAQYANGRVLTADSLRKEQLYLDARARVVGQVTAPGVVWGLGLRVPGQVPAAGAPSAVGTAVDLDGPSVLEPGLALDAAGRPIAVGGERVFTFRELIRRSAELPLEVVAGGTAFQPCVCLRPAPARAVGGAVQTGAWLLVLSPEERPEGEAKLYGVRTQSPIGCVPDGWRGGYTLSLARLALDVSTLRAADAWALRGEVVAWLFDTSENDLSRRWASGGPGDALPASADLGRPPTAASAVALALVLIAPDGGVLFCDRWAPRRPVVETTPADWVARGKGGESGARALARSRQFQAMLLESLSVLDMLPGGGDGRRRDLRSRGFRHIPPAGTLPVHSAAITGADAIARAKATLRAARAWFEGTNVVLGEEIALHDDIVLDEQAKASRLDPIRLRPDPGVPSDGTPLDGVLHQPSLRSFGAALTARRVTLEQLASEEIVLVRMIVGLHPTGATTEPRSFVAFVRHSPRIALDLPPAPAELVVDESPEEQPLAVSITGPAEGESLWQGRYTTFTWNTTGGTGGIRHTATLRGRIWSTIFGGTPERRSWEERLTLDRGAQSGAITIPNHSFAGLLSLTVMAEDADGTQVESSPRSWTLKRRSVKLKAPITASSIYADESVLIQWELSEGWSSTARLAGKASIHWQKTESRTVGTPQRGTIPLTESVVVGEVDTEVPVSVTLSGRAGEALWPLGDELRKLNIYAGQLTLTIVASDEETHGLNSASAVLNVLSVNSRAPR